MVPSWNMRDHHEFYNRSSGECFQRAKKSGVIGWKNLNVKFLIVDSNIRRTINNVNKVKPIDLSIHKWSSSICGSTEGGQTRYWKNRCSALFFELYVVNKELCLLLDGGFTLMHEGAFVFLCFEWLTLVDREQKSNRVGIVKRFDEKITLNPVVFHTPSSGRAQMDAPYCRQWQVEQQQQASLVEQCWR